MRVLLVEDDALLGDGLRAGLGQAGFAVDWVRTGSDAVHALDAEPVAAVVLDLGLPDLSGFEVLRRLRARGNKVPVLILTARDAVDDRVKGLDGGADDYVVKPVVAKELSARIRALLRRSRKEAAPSGTVASGALEVHPRQGVVTLNGEQVPLTTTEFRLLEQLAERVGEVVTREALLERVWGHDFVQDTRLLDVHVSRLRSKIEENPGRPQRVVTVRGIGYKLTA